MPEKLWGGSQGREHDTKGGVGRSPGFCCGPRSEASSPSVCHAFLVSLRGREERSDAHRRKKKQQMATGHHPGKKEEEEDGRLTPTKKLESFWLQTPNSASA